MRRVTDKQTALKVVDNIPGAGRYSDKPGTTLAGRWKRYAVLLVMGVCLSLVPVLWRTMAASETSTSRDRRKVEAGSIHSSTRLLGGDQPYFLNVRIIRRVSRPRFWTPRVLLFGGGVPGERAVWVDQPVRRIPGHMTMLMHLQPGPG